MKIEDITKGGSPKYKLLRAPKVVNPALAHHLKNKCNKL